ncbi:MAG: NTP transferase domain-containing protein [Rickettsiales bacterium]|jgi:UTP-glucose-1-phosphate uridylyltransferase|nr:NTP transferase domain-containing protein [Rickettsiales bacterium]
MNCAENLEFVILAAGKSTRNYPQSKGLPHKSLMPFSDHKIIDEIMLRLADAGARHVTLVVSDQSVVRHFEDAFRPEPALEEKFAKAGNAEMLELVRGVRLPDDMDIKYVIQGTPRGTGQAMGLAYAAVRDSGRNLAMVFPDDMIVAENGAEHIYSRAVRQYSENGGRGNLAITREVDDPSRWGVVQDGYLLEKPKQATSRDSVVSLVIFDKSVGQEFYKDALRLERGEEIDGLVGGELVYMNALNRSIDADFATNALQKCKTTENDVYLDCGTVSGYEKSLVYSLTKLSRFKKDNRWTD